MHDFAPAFPLASSATFQPEPALARLVIDHTGKVLRPAVVSAPECMALLRLWASDEAAVQPILVDNPRQLYGF